MNQEPYAPCRCGSGKAFKFCCRPHTKTMKIRRLNALELLGALRSLDNFKFKPEVVDALIANVVVLRKLSEEIGVYREELAKQVGCPVPNDPSSPNFREFDRHFGEYLTKEVEADLTQIAKADWDFGHNSIPITTRERLLPVVGS